MCDTTELDVASSSPSLSARRMPVALKVETMAELRRELLMETGTHSGGRTRSPSTRTSRESDSLPIGGPDRANASGSSPVGCETDEGRTDPGGDLIRRWYRGSIRFWSVTAWWRPAHRDRDEAKSGSSGRSPRLVADRRHPHRAGRQDRSPRCESVWSRTSCLLRQFEAHSHALVRLGEDGQLSHSRYWAPRVTPLWFIGTPIRARLPRTFGLAPLSSVVSVDLWTE